jgi:hypothetical protein
VEEEVACFHSFEFAFQDWTAGWVLEGWGVDVESVELVLERAESVEVVVLLVLVKVGFIILLLSLILTVGEPWLIFLSILLLLQELIFLSPLVFSGLLPSR